MQFEAHSDCRSHHLLQQVQVSKNPLVFGGNAEVTFEQGVKTIQERFQTERKNKRKNKRKERKTVRELNDEIKDLAANAPYWCKSKCTGADLS